METSHLPTELRDLVTRIAMYPHGLGFLHQSYLDSVAITLGVHPFVVEAARELLETPSGRALMIEEVRLARERLHHIDSADANTADHPAGLEGSLEAAVAKPGSCEGRPAAGVDSSASAETETPEDLILAAQKHPLGIRFLLQAPPETVAVTFGVHPFLVFRARGVIRTRKIRKQVSDE